VVTAVAATCGFFAASVAQPPIDSAAKIVSAHQLCCTENLFAWFSINRPAKFFVVTVKRSSPTYPFVRLEERDFKPKSL
jgi:hypothetical protein